MEGLRKYKRMSKREEQGAFIERAFTE